MAGIFKSGYGNDSIVGTTGSDDIYSAGGRDTVRAGGGDDMVWVMEADTIGDLLYGEAGSDTISGGNPADMLDGGDGDDNLFGEAGSDVLNGGLGDDYIDGGDGNDSISGADGQDRLYGAGGNDVLDGGLGDDYIDGGDGNDLIKGGEGADRVYCGAGADTIYGGGGADDIWGNVTNIVAMRLYGDAGNDRLNGAMGNDALYGGTENDSLYGHEGNDLLDGGDGNDKLHGGVGADTIRGGNGNDYVWFDATDTTGDSVYADAGDDTVVASTGHTYMNGGVGTDLLMGDAGNDTLDGGAGADSLVGDAGGDRYVVDNRGDVINEWTAGAGDSVLIQTDGYKVPSSIESVSYAPGIEPLVYFTNTLLYNEQSRWCRVPGQSMHLTFSFNTSDPGAAGFRAFNDADKANTRAVLAKYAAVSGLTFTEVAANGNLRFEFKDVAPSAGLGERPPMAGVGWNATTTWVDDGYTSLASGTYGHEVLLHEIGHNLGFKHPHEAPILPVAEDNNTNTVMTYNHTGTNATNIGKFDVMNVQYLYGVNTTARAGNDIYQVVNAGGNLVWDGAGVDVLTAAGTATGAVLDLRQGHRSWVGSKTTSILAANQAYVNFGTVIENATGGNGNDKLTGNTGNNVLNGGAGGDTMAGGAGDDTYVVNATTDVVTEAANAGTDTVQSSVSHTLGANQENLVLTGTAIIIGTGNTLSNKLTGNAATNVLAGGAGRDSLQGGAGNDRLIGANTGAPFGAGEIDTLTGGAGNDVFVLGTGSAVYYNDAVAANAGRADYALITDFTTGQDKLQLKGLAAQYTMAAHGIAGLAGNGLWFEQGATDELVAVVRSGNTTVLTPSNTIATATFV